MSFSSESSVAMRSSTIVSMYARSAARVASCRRRRRDASGSPRRCRAASRSGRSETVHAWASARCSVRISSSVSPGAHSRRYAGTDHRSPTRSVGSSSGHARLRAAFRSLLPSSARRSWSRSTSSSSTLSTRISSSASRTWSRASLCGVPGLGRLERLRPVVGADPHVEPGRLDLHALLRRPLVEPDGRLDRPDQLHRRLEPGHLRVGLDRRPRHPPRRGPAACTSGRPPPRGWAGRRRRSRGTAGAGRRTARRRAGDRGAGRSTGGRRCGAGRRRSCRCPDRRRRRARPPTPRG